MSGQLGTELAMRVPIFVERFLEPQARSQECGSSLVESNDTFAVP